MCIACGPLRDALNRPALRSTRRIFAKGSAAAVTTGFFAASSAFLCDEAQGQSPLGDTLYTGGPILTMSDRTPIAEAVLVRDGRILAVGSNAVLRNQMGPVSRVVDLRGKTMLPGFFDPHGHVVMIGLQALSADLLPPPDGECSDIDSLQRLLREWIARNSRAIERYGIVIGFGYDDSQLKEQRHPTRDELDAVSGDVPILIIHQSGHLGVLNSKALEAVGATAESEDPAGGAFRRREGSTEPNGVCEEAAFFQAVGKLVSKFDEAAYLAMIKAGAESCARFGYTTVQEARAMDSTVAMLNRAAELNILPVDVLAYPDILDAVASINPALEYKNRMRIGGAKLTIDGSPQGKTAFLSAPYFVPPPDKDPGYAGYTAITEAQLRGAVDLAYSKGWQILTHANGDAAIDMLISAIDAAERKYGSADRRPVLIHGQTARLDQLPKLKLLGIIPSFFPMHTFYWGDWHRDSVLGPERAARISPCASAQRLGMIFTSHHDAPVANPDSMRVLSATVTRKTRSGTVLGPEERVDVQTALKAMTIWAAHQHFEEASKGSIEAGKLADFVILDRNPLNVREDELSGLRVIQTIKSGNVVHSAE